MPVVHFPNQNLPVRRPSISGPLPRLNFSSNVCTSSMKMVLSITVRCSTFMTPSVESRFSKSEKFTFYSFAMSSIYVKRSYS